MILLFHVEKQLEQLMQPFHPYASLYVQKAEESEAVKQKYRNYSKLILLLWKAKPIQY